MFQKDHLMSQWDQSSLIDRNQQALIQLSHYHQPLKCFLISSLYERYHSYVSSK